MSSVLNGPFDAWANRFSIRSRIPMISANKTASVGSSCGERADVRAASRNHSETFLPAFEAAVSISLSSASVSLLAMDFVREVSLPVEVEGAGSTICCDFMSGEAIGNTPIESSLLFAWMRLDVA